jgi:hypothetical protein
VKKNLYEDKFKIRNLKILGLIWGFLKYYHPAVGTGKYNWDKELFRLIPIIVDCENTVDRDKILTEWIYSLGELEINKGNPTSTSKDIKIEPDFRWLEKSGFSDKLKIALNKVKKTERTGKNHYVRLVNNIWNPKFKNENKYKAKNCPDTNKRILSLFRYWNMVQYFYPYKYLIEEDWTDILEKFIPKFIHAEGKNNYFLAILELITLINDTHAHIGGADYMLENLKGAYFAPVDLSFIENHAVVTGFYNAEYGNKSGLKKGDVILSINGIPIDKMINEKLKYSPASNYVSKVRLILGDLLRTHGDEIHVEIQRGHISVNKELSVYSYKELDLSVRYRVDDTSFKMIRDDIAYLNNGSLKRKDVPNFWKNIKDTKGLIIDCRPYPYDYPMDVLCKYLLPKKTLFCKMTGVNLYEPGQFIYKHFLSAGKKNREYYKGRVIILINEVSLSSAEFHVMSYQIHPNSTIIGSTTAGADGNVSLLTLPGNVITGFTALGVYYPDGAETQGIGIVPDIEIKPTIRGIREERDELIEKAIEIIDEN